MLTTYSTRRSSLWVRGKLMPHATTGRVMGSPWPLVSMSIRWIIRRGFVRFSLYALSGYWIGRPSVDLPLLPGSSRYSRSASSRSSPLRPVRSIPLVETL